MGYKGMLPKKHKNCTEEFSGVSDSLNKELILSNIRKFKILSTLPYDKISFWYENIHSFSRKEFTFFKNKKLGVINKALYIVKLASTVGKGNFDLVLLTGGEKVDLAYLAICSLFLKKKTPHFIVCAEWTPRKSRVKSFIQKAYFKLIDGLIEEVQPISKEEIDIYHKKFGVPRKKLKAIPFSTTLTGYDLKPKKGDFILTGGVSFRDYDMFLKVANELSLPIEIGIPGGCESLPTIGDVKKTHIKIHFNLSRKEFMQKTADCRFFVMPLQPTLERSVGDQSILNAMYFGKIVIATDSIGPRIYIRNGINGFLVPESDPSAWVSAIRHVISLNDDEYAEISSNAEYTAKEIFNEEKKLLKIMDSANSFLAERSRRG
ncbi:MAG: glycosyltransferase [Leptospirales bacterium]